MLDWVIVDCAGHSGQPPLPLPSRARQHLALHNARGGAAADTQEPRCDGEAGARQQEGQGKRQQDRES